MRNVAVAALTKNLADELGPSGINVTVVHPGLTRTERTAPLVAARAAAQGVSPKAVEAQMAAGNSIHHLVDAERGGACRGLPVLAEVAAPSTATRSRSAAARRAASTTDHPRCGLAAAASAPAKPDPRRPLGCVRVVRSAASGFQHPGAPIGRLCCAVAELA